MADVQPVALLVDVHDAEAALAARSDAEQPVLQLPEIDDPRQRADLDGAAPSRRLASLDDERDAEAGVFAHAAVTMSM